MTYTFTVLQKIKRNSKPSPERATAKGFATAGQFVPKNLHNSTTTAKILKFLSELM